MRHFFAHVAGESFPNRDGSDRQAIIAECGVGEPLRLESEPDNPVDPDAIRVVRESGKQIGYLEQHLAARFAAEGFNRCHPFVAGVGRGGAGPYLGVALLIVVDRDDRGEAAVAAHAERVLAGRIRRPVGVARARVAARTRQTAAAVSDNQVVIAVVTLLGLALIVAVGIRVMW